MILILSSNINEKSAEYQQLMAHLASMPGIQSRIHVERGAEQNLTEIYLIGNTKQLETKDMQALPGVEIVGTLQHRLLLFVTLDAQLWG